MAAIEHHGHVGAILRDFSDQDGQFLVGEIVSARAAAVVADQALVLSVGIELAKGRARRAPRTMATELEHRDVTLASLAEVRVEAVDDAGAGGTGVLQGLDRDFAAGETLCEVLVEAVHVIEAAGEVPDLRWIVVDAHQQGVHPVRHGPPASCRAAQTV